MKDLHQREFIELNRLLGKFSVHLDRKLMKTLFAEYKKLLTRSHRELPDNTFFREKVRTMDDMERKLDTTDPGTVKLHLQHSLSDIVSEIDAVNRGLDA